MPKYITLPPLMPQDMQAVQKMPVEIQTANPVAARLRAVSTGGGSQPDSKIKDLCSEGAAEIDRLQDAAENVVIAFGMGWDMNGVIEQLRGVIDRRGVTDNDSDGDHE